VISEEGKGERRKEKGAARWGDSENSDYSDLSENSEIADLSKK
jgi:hypothetical protein